VLPPGERAKNARGISPPSLLSRFTQHYLVAMATSLDKSSVLNEPRERTSDVQRRGAIYHVLYNMRNSYYLRSNDDVNMQRSFHLLACSQAESTGPIFTKILHDIVALVMLLNHAYTRRYPIPFPNSIATK